MVAPEHTLVRQARLIEGKVATLTPGEMRLQEQQLVSLLARLPATKRQQVLDLARQIGSARYQGVGFLEAAAAIANIVTAVGQLGLATAGFVIAQKDKKTAQRQAGEREAKAQAEADAIKAQEAAKEQRLQEQAAVAQQQYQAQVAQEEKSSKTPLLVGGGIAAAAAALLLSK